MPIYVVMDSKNNWLEYGEYDTPEEALVDGLQSSDFDLIDKPFQIMVYEVVNGVEFNLDLNSGEYIR